MDNLSPFNMWTINLSGLRLLKAVCADYDDAVGLPIKPENPSAPRLELEDAVAQRLAMFWIEDYPMLRCPRQQIGQFGQIPAAVGLQLLHEFSHLAAALV